MAAGIRAARRATTFKSWHDIFDTDHSIVVNEKFMVAADGSVAKQAGDRRALHTTSVGAPAPVRGADDEFFDFEALPDEAPTPMPVMAQTASVSEPMAFFSAGVAMLTREFEPITELAQVASLSEVTETESPEKATPMRVTLHSDSEQDEPSEDDELARWFSTSSQGHLMTLRLEDASSLKLAKSKKLEGPRKRKIMLSSA